MGLRTTVSACLLSLWLVSQAQENQDKTTQASTDEKTIDEITVMGARSLAALRIEIVRAEDEIYDIYNVLNDDDGYDIICKKETRIGSQIPRRTCQARIFRDAAAEAAQDLLEGDELAGATLNASQHNKILREKMSALASAHPELLTALRMRRALEKRFAEERAKKYD